VAELVLTVVRGAVALCCGAAAVVALTHWLVRRGTLSPFGAWARGVRQLTSPAVRATERRVLARGGNPQDAPYWLLAALVLGGLVLLSLTQWLLGFAIDASGAISGGGRSIAYFLVRATFNALIAALLIRAIGSWFGVGRWTWWMRPFHQATDWLLTPLRRVIPPIGMFDITPVVAMVLLSLLRDLVVRLLF
jgi:YggT family protein